MSAEFIRRRLVTRIGGNKKNDVIKALEDFFNNFESTVGTIEEIEAPAGEYLRFRTKDTKYEVYNWMPYVDIAESKKKGVELQPLAYRAFEEDAGGGGGRNLFGNFLNADISIVWFCVFALWLGLVVSGLVVAKAVFFK